jgi:hypothetical protein
MNNEQLTITSGANEKTVNCQLSIVNYQLSIINYQLIKGSKLRIASPTEG